MENYSHPHDNGNILNRTSMDMFIYLTKAYKMKYRFIYIHA